MTANSAVAPGAVPKVPAWVTSTRAETLTPTQIAEVVRAAGGTTSQAQMGAAISAGAEDRAGTTQVLAGGRGPAQGLWQFEPTTWRQYAPPGAPPTATGATPLQQAQAFVRDVNANKGYASWAPDLGATWGTNPTSPRPGSPVASYLGTHHTQARTTGILTWFGELSGAGAVAGGITGQPSGGAVATLTPVTKLEQWVASGAVRVGLVIFGAVLVVVGVIMLLRGAHTEELRVVTDGRGVTDAKGAEDEGHAAEAKDAAEAAVVAA